jgi:hypothetical protein
MVPSGAQGMPVIIGELVTYIWPTLFVKVEIKKKCY